MTGAKSPALKRRARWLVLAGIVAAGAGASAWVVLASGDGEPRAEPTATGAPSPSPTVTAPEPSPTATPTSLPPVLSIGCETGRTQGDFDGDGSLDTAVTHYPRPEGGCLDDPFGIPLAYRLGVQFGAGTLLDAEVGACESLCNAFGAVDLDEDGRDELALHVASGASTTFVSFFVITGEAVEVVRVAPPGEPSFQPGDRMFPLGGSVTHLNYLTCQRNDGVRLIATAAELSGDGSTYHIHEVVFLFDGSAFVPLSSEDREVSFDEFNSGAPPVTGTTCPGLPG